jgi:hypothetical protein
VVSALTNGFIFSRRRARAISLPAPLRPVEFLLINAAESKS